MNRVFFNFVKQFYFLLIFITIFTGCIKKNTTNVLQDNTGDSLSIETVSLMENLITHANIEEGLYTVDTNNAVLVYDQSFLEDIINEQPNAYLTADLLERVLKEPNFSINDLLFDETKSGLRIYHGGRLFYDSDTLLRYIDYMNYNIILVTQEIENIEYVHDYMILEKKNPETYLFKTVDNATINGEFPDFDLTVVINSRWRGLYTEDISHAFKINTETGKIEPVFFDTIRLASEL